MAKTPVSTIAQFAPCVIYVRGKVAFSRIASKVEGEELNRQNQIAASKGRMPHSKPYTSISIKNPVILDNGKLPPQVKSVIQERFYSRQDGTMMFTQESKSPFLPMVLYSNEVKELAGQCIANNDVHLQGELAVDLDITVGVSLFSKNNFAGLGIKYVLLNEPVRYYTNSELNNDLAELGITYTAPVINSTPVVENVQTPTTPAFTQPVQQSVTPPWEDTAPFQTQPVQQPAFTQPVQQPIFTQQAAPAQSMQSTQIERPVRYY